MIETDMIERLVAVEEGRKSNTKRLDEHDLRIDNLEKTYSIMEKMNYRMENVEMAVEKIDKKLDENQEEKGKKWDKLIDYIFYSVIAVILGFIYMKLGLK